MKRQKRAVCMNLHEREVSKNGDHGPQFRMANIQFSVVHRISVGGRQAQSQFNSGSESHVWSGHVRTDFGLMVELGLHPHENSVPKTEFPAFPAFGDRRELGFHQ